MVLLSFAAGFIQDESLEFASLVLSAVTSIMWVYLILMFRRFMEVRFEIKGLRKYVNLLILLTIVLTVQSILMGHEPESGSLDIATIGYIAMLVPYGIVAILFGRTLLSIDTPYPYLRAFAWLTMLAGIAFASIVLLLVAMPIGFAADVLMALMFFAGRKELLSVPDAKRA